MQLPGRLPRMLRYLGFDLRFFTRDPLEFPFRRSVGEHLLNCLTRLLRNFGFPLCFQFFQPFPVSSL